jgi:hypothetical protein
MVLLIQCTSPWVLIPVNSAATLINRQYTLLAQMFCIRFTLRTYSAGSNDRPAAIHSATVRFGRHPGSGERQTVSGTDDESTTRTFSKFPDMTLAHRCTSLSLAPSVYLQEGSVSGIRPTGPSRCFMKLVMTWRFPAGRHCPPVHRDAAAAPLVLPCSLHLQVDHAYLCERNASRVVLVRLLPLACPDAILQGCRLPRAFKTTDRFSGSKLLLAPDFIGETTPECRAGGVDVRFEVSGQRQWLEASLARCFETRGAFVRDRIRRSRCQRFRAPGVDKGLLYCGVPSALRALRNSFGNTILISCITVVFPKEGQKRFAGQAPSLQCSGQPTINTTIFGPSGVPKKARNRVTWLFFGDTAGIADRRPAAFYSPVCGFERGKKYRSSPKGRPINA